MDWKRDYLYTYGNTETMLDRQPPPARGIISISIAKTRCVGDPSDDTLYCFCVVQQSLQCLLAATNKGHCLVIHLRSQVITNLQTIIQQWQNFQRSTRSASAKLCFVLVKALVLLSRGCVYCHRCTCVEPDGWGYIHHMYVLSQQVKGLRPYNAGVCTIPAGYRGYPTMLVYVLSQQVIGATLQHWCMYYPSRLQWLPYNTGVCTIPAGYWGYPTTLVYVLSQQVIGATLQHWCMYYPSRLQGLPYNTGVCTIPAGYRGYPTTLVYVQVTGLPYNTGVHTIPVGYRPTYPTPIPGSSYVECIKLDIHFCSIVKQH